ncbi:MAG: efflux transporter outer membrane subunit [Acidobacteriota bacterium]
MRRPRPDFLVACLLLAAACAKPPPLGRVELGIEVPDSWQAEGRAPRPRSDLIDEAWWRDFHDEALTRLVEESLANNHDLRAAAARIRRAIADARIAGADLSPEAQVSVSGSRRRQNFIGFPVPGGERTVLRTQSTSLGASLDVVWEADLWGRLRAGTRAAMADAQATDADFHAARLSLAGQTAKAWFAAIEAGQQVALAESTVANWRASSEQVRERYERGLRPSLDLRLSRSNLESAKALLHQRRQELDADVRQLQTLLGRYPAGGLPLGRTLPDTPPPVPAGLPADLLARRPDLVSAERRLIAADQRLAAARRALYPRFSLTGSGGTSSNQLRDLVDSDFRVWSILGGIVQPLFQGGRLRRGIDRSRALVDEALEVFAGTALAAYREVESALAAERFLAQREHHLDLATRQARSARELAQDRYRRGLHDYITVLEAQRRALAEESSWLAARRSRLQNRVDLYLALGGGFSMTREATAR